MDDRWTRPRWLGLSPVSAAAGRTRAVEPAGDYAPPACDVERAAECLEDEAGLSESLRLASAAHSDSFSRLYTRTLAYSDLQEGPRGYRAGPTARCVCLRWAMAALAPLSFVPSSVASPPNNARSPSLPHPATFQDKPPSLLGLLASAAASAADHVAPGSSGKTTHGLIGNGHGNGNAHGGFRYGSRPLTARSRATRLAVWLLAALAFVSVGLNLRFLASGAGSAVAVRSPY